MAMKIRAMEPSQARFITFTVKFKCKWCSFACRVLHEIEHHAITNHCAICPFMCSACGHRHRTIESTKLHVKCCHNPENKGLKIIEQDWSRWSQFLFVVSSYDVQLGVEYRSNAQFTCNFCNIYASTDFNEMLIHLVQNHPSWLSPSHCDLCTYDRLIKIRDLNALRVFGRMKVPSHNLALCLVTRFKVAILPDVPHFPMWKSTTTIWNNLLNMASQCPQFTVTNQAPLPMHSTWPIPTATGPPTIALPTNQDMSVVTGPKYDSSNLPQREPCSNSPSGYLKQLSQLTVSPPDPPLQENLDKLDRGKEPWLPAVPEPDPGSNPSPECTQITENTGQKFVDSQNEIFYDETLFLNDQVDSVGNSTEEDSLACVLDLSNHSKDSSEQEEVAPIDLSKPVSNKKDAKDNNKTFPVRQPRQKQAVNALKTNLLKYLVRLRNAKMFAHNSRREQEQYVATAIQEFLHFHKVRIFDRKGGYIEAGIRRRKAYDGEVIDLTKEDSVSLSCKQNGLAMSREGVDHLVKLAFRHLQKYFDGYEKGLTMGRNGARGFPYQT